MNSEREINSVENVDKSGVFEFSGFTFDMREKILRRGRETISMPPKTCDLLAALLEKHGRLLTKDELFEKVWGDVFVEETNLTHHIAVLRRTLGEDGGAAGGGRNFIETVPRRGYRFAAPVRQNTPAAAESIELTVKEQSQVRTIIIKEVETNDDDLSLQSSQLPPQLPEKSLNDRRHGGRPAIWKFVLFGVFIVAAVFFGWRFFGWANRSVIFIPETKIKRVTPDAFAYAPSISPDGASVVFVKLENGLATLWRRQIATGAMTQLLPANAVREASIVSTRFSPDGRWVYFKQISPSMRKPAVFRVGASGSAPQKIVENVESDFSISPDGKQLAFTRGYRFLVVADAAENGAEERIAADGNKIGKTLRSDPSSSVAWSADGTRLAFSASTWEGSSPVQQLWELDLKTAAISSVRIDKDLGNIYQIEWLPDDGGFLVTRDESWAMPDQIWHIAGRDGKTRRISNEMDDFDRAIRLSADGKTLVAKQALGHYNLWVAPLDNLEKRKQITLGAAAQHGKSGVSFTPQGEIIYTSLESEVMDLWKISQDGSNKIQLTVNSGKFNSYPQISRDARFLVFNSKRSGAGQVWRTDIDGRNPVQLSPGVENRLICISPENEVYYTADSTAEKNRYYKISIEGGEPVPLNDYYYASATMNFSPDGKWLLIYGGAKQDDPPRFSLIDRENGKIVRYFDNIPTNTVLGWSPDSKSILVSEIYGEALFRYPLEGGEPQKLMEFLPNRVYQFAVSPDGKNIAFSLGNTTAEVVLIENFSAAEK